ncbi:hypothetical protein [Streptomyces collinus]|uniref:hypothetical protein n=1 Tax=Streptomyces collinus TaxID=42684 RepID=UPI003F53FAB4
MLDSSVDPARAWRGMIQVWAEGAEPAFAHWTKWSARHHRTYGLGDTPAAVRRTFWDLVARADRSPDHDGRKLTGDAIATAGGQRDRCLLDRGLRGHRGLADRCRRRTSTARCRVSNGPD